MCEGKHKTVVSRGKKYDRGGKLNKLNCLKIVCFPPKSNASVTVLSIVAEQLMNTFAIYTRSVQNYKYLIAIEICTITIYVQ